MDAPAPLLGPLLGVLLLLVALVLASAVLYAVVIVGRITYRRMHPTAARRAYVADGFLHVRADAHWMVPVARVLEVERVGADLAVKYTGLRASKEPGAETRRFVDVAVD